MIAEYQSNIHMDNSHARFWNEQKYWGKEVIFNERADVWRIAQEDLKNLLEWIEG